MPVEFLYNLTKNLTAHLQHNLCAVLPIRDTTKAPDERQGLCFQQLFAVNECVQVFLAAC